MSHLRKYDSLKSKDDKFWCNNCNSKSVYTTKGFLKGDFPYDSVYDWGVWAEKSFYEEMKDKEDDVLLFGDKNVRLYKILLNEGTEDICTGDLLLYRNKMVLNDFIFDYKDVSELAMLYYGKSLLFTHNKEYCGITGESLHALKAYHFYRLSEIK